MAGEEQEVVIREAGILFEQTVSSEAIHPWCMCVCVCVCVCVRARACALVGGMRERARERERACEREHARERRRERENERERMGERAEPVSKCLWSAASMAAEICGLFTTNAGGIARLFTSWHTCEAQCERALQRGR